MSESEKVKVPSGNLYGASAGQFLWQGAEGGGYKVETCRDRMQNHLDTVDCFFFCNTKGRSDNVINFIRQVEQIANVKDEDALELKLTNQDNFVYVKLTVWWKHRVRRNLLTALLRCGDNFVEDSGKGFTKALWSITYTKETQEAVIAFLGGRTAIKMKKNAQFNGWWSMFANKKGAEVTSVLVRTKRKKKEPEVANQLPQTETE